MKTINLRRIAKLSVIYLGVDKAYCDLQKRRKSWVNLRDISYRDSKMIIEFLKEWKSVRGMPLSQRRKIAYSLTSTLKGLSLYFQEVLGYRIINLDLNSSCNISGKKYKMKNVVKYIYNKLKSVQGVGATNASKIMHIIAPELFVMWDEAIRNKFIKTKSKLGTAKQYVTFLNRMRLYSHKLSYPSIPISITIKRKPTLAKLIDEINYLKYTKGLKIS